MEFTTEFGNDPSISETSFFHSLGLQTADRTDDLSQINSAIEDSSLGRNIETMSQRELGAGQNSDMSFFDAIGLYWVNPASDKPEDWIPETEATPSPTQSWNRPTKPEDWIPESEATPSPTQSWNRPTKSEDWIPEPAASPNSTQSWNRPAPLCPESWLRGPTNQTQDVSQTSWFPEEGGEKMPYTSFPVLKLPELEQNGVDELDFLTVLGLTRVEAPERNRWRLWNPEEDESWVGGENILPADYHGEPGDTDPTDIEIQAHHIGKKIIEEKEDFSKENSGKYFCQDCNRTLSSEVVWRRHLNSELHFKNSAKHDTADSSCQLRNSKSTPIQRDRRNQTSSEKSSNEKSSNENRTKCAKSTLTQDNEIDETRAKDEEIEETRAKLKLRMVECESCGARVQFHQFPKHLISHFHYHRSIGHPSSDRLILENFDGIVRQSPFQCQPCQFYCNWHRDLVDHVLSHSASGPYWCVICVRILNSDTDLNDHLRSDDHLELISVINRSVPTIIKNLQLVPCDICNRKFRLNLALKKHMKSVHGLTGYQLKGHQKYTCNYCEYWSYKQKSLQIHSFLVHPRKDLKYKCTICRTEYKTAVLLKQHRNTGLHRESVDRISNPEQHQTNPCNFCGEEFQGIECLKLHMQTQHLRVLPQCSLCGEIFHFTQQLTGHIQQSCSSKSGILAYAGNYPCDLCNFSTDNKPRFNKHRQIKHKEQILETSLDFRCDDCFRKFVSEELLSLHNLKHHKVEELFACTYSNCSYQTTKKKLFSLHIKRTHSNKETIFSCDQCDKTFQTKPGLKNHRESTHMGRKVESFSCPYTGCDFVAGFLSDLERHKFKHSADKSIFCQTCDFSCKRKSELTRHFKLKHSDSPPLHCAECTYTTRNTSHMTRHRKLVHSQATGDPPVNSFQNIDPCHLVVVPRELIEEQIVL